MSKWEELIIVQRENARNNNINLNTWNWKELFILYSLFAFHILFLEYCNSLPVSCANAVFMHKSKTVVGQNTRITVKGYEKVSALADAGLTTQHKLPHPQLGRTTAGWNQTLQPTRPNQASVHCSSLDALAGLAAGKLFLGKRSPNGMPQSRVSRVRRTLDMCGNTSTEASCQLGLQQPRQWAWQEHQSREPGPQSPVANGPIQTTNDESNSVHSIAPSCFAFNHPQHLETSILWESAAAASFQVK